MKRLLIVGVDTVAGRSLAERCSKNWEVVGLGTSSDTHSPAPCSFQAPISLSSLQQQCKTADVVVFCGDAARSSWDDDFGTLAFERRWLQKCVDAASSARAKLIFISSDVVFDGPWIFHDDNSRCVAKTPLARLLLGYEELAASVPESLIVRTNIVAVTREGFLQEALNSFCDGRETNFDASTFATPIAAPDFANALLNCMNDRVHGFINIGGSERTTPFAFALSLGRSMSADCSLIQPNPVATRMVERSLRCQRLRSELSLPTPLLKETLESLTDAVSEFAAVAVAA